MEFGISKNEHSIILNILKEYYFYVKFNIKIIQNQSLMAKVHQKAKLMANLIK